MAKRRSHLGFGLLALVGLLGAACPPPNPTAAPMGADGLPRLELYLAAKEAVSNALKHARATEIRATIATEGHSLLLDVADDGRGMEHPGDPTGNGLANASERLRQVGGRVEHDPPGFLLAQPLGDLCPGWACGNSGRTEFSQLFHELSTAYLTIERLLEADRLRSALRRATGLAFTCATRRRAARHS